MSILTKICVVVLVVLCLASALVFINMAVVHPNYRYHYQQEQRRSKLWEQTARYAELSNEVAIQERNAAMALVRKKDEQLAATTDTFATELKDERAKSARLQGELDDGKAQNVVLSKTLQANSQRQALLDQQLRELRGRVVKLNEDKNGLAQALRKAQDDYEKQKMIARAHMVTIVDQKAQIRSLEKKLVEIRTAAATTAEPAPAGAVPEITGEITSVRGEIAAINVGAAQGVKNGMELVIHRGAKFVGHLRIDRVEADGAAGFIYDKRLDPKAGDKVMSGAALRQYE